MTATARGATNGPPPTARPNSRNRRLWLGYGIGLFATLALLVASLFIGVYDITGDTDGWRIFFITRVPRTIAIALAGSAMAVCGLVMQLLTQNRFVEPTTAGTTDWASLGLIGTMVLVPGASITTRMVGAIIASFVGTLVFFGFIRRIKFRSSLVIPIIGMMLGAVVGAFSTYIALTFDMLQNLAVWFAGNFTSVVRGRYELLWIVLLVNVAIYVLADRFTVAGLGKDIATNIGLNYDRVVLIGVGIVAVATGIVTVVIGSLPFLGLIVPNLVALFRGDHLRTNLPWVAMAGTWVLVVCDIIARSVIMPFEMPVSVILGIVGAIVFVGLLVRGRKHA